jgi:hypothetical protein
LAIGHTEVKTSQNCDRCLAPGQPLKMRIAWCVVALQVQPELDGAEGEGQHLEDLESIQ